MKITKHLIEEISLEKFAEKHDLELEILERGANDWCAPGPYMRYYTHFKSSWISDGICLTGVSGNGTTEQEAVDNYKQRISNQHLVIDALNGQNRKDINVPFLI